MKLKLASILAILVFFSCLNYKPVEKDAWIFYYFEGYAGDKAGLFAAYSYDLHTWQPLADSLIAAEIGEWNVFRDPSVIKDPDGKFHVVWTTGSSGFGYSNSENGINWENVEFITVADPERGLEFANVWAPEFYVEGDSVYIIWSSTLMEDYVPPKNPEQWWASTWNHRLYYTVTTDFKNFTPTQKFWDTGFNAIDATVHKTDSLYYIFFKDERRPPKQIMMAQSKTLLGPYENIQPLAYSLTEGAIALQTDTAFVLYYDYYHEYNGYRYITTTDIVNWSDEIMPEKVGFEDVIRHGSIVKVRESELKKMLELEESRN
jgi:hypothetical protein